MKSPAAILFVAVACEAIGAPPAPQRCSWKTLAGPAVTFRGDGVDVSQAIFNGALALAAGPDGSIYVADTGNNKVRRITADGIVRTVAGTGELGFSGDGGVAINAAMNQPAGLAVAADGTLYISDTANNRVRVVGADGVIHTIAGEGHPRFGGDAGPAAAASLNSPHSLTIDSDGHLVIADTGNNRVRRVGGDGVIQTTAGSQGRDDYYPDPPASRTAPPAGPGVNTPLYSISSVRADGSGGVYISDALALRRLDKGGTLTTVIFYTPVQPYSATPPVTAGTPIENLAVTAAIPLPLADGSLALLATGQVAQVTSSGARYSVTVTQLIHVADGIADAPVYVTGDPSTGIFPPLVLDASADSAGGIVALTTGSGLLQAGLSGAVRTIFPTVFPQSDPAKVQSPLDLSLTVGSALAVGPDQTIYIGQSNGAVIALKPDGSVVTAARFSVPITSMAVDSKGTLFVGGEFVQIFKQVAGGSPQLVAGTSGPVLSLRFDSQDRLYVFQNDRLSPLVRIDPDGTRTNLQVPTLYGGDSLFPTSLSAYPMAVSADGTVYLGFTTPFPVPSLILKWTTGATGLPTLPTDRPVEPGALAVTPAGEIYLTDFNGVIYKRLDDGTLVSIVGGDRYGFWGENGYDSARQPPLGTYPGDLIADRQGGLLVFDPTSRSVKRIDLSSCTLAASPYIRGVAESATSNTSLKFAAGQLVSIYGGRLGPDTGVSTQFDATGHLPNQAFGTQVLMNGIAAPLLYVGASQINAAVPFDLAGQGPVSISVVRNGLSSDVVLGQTGYYGPAFFSYTPSPGPTSAHFLSMLNADGTVNSATHPAKLGSVVTLFATGTGATNPPGDDGAQAGLPLKYTAAPMTIQIATPAGLITAEVLYAGTAPTLVEGVTQINVRLPASLNGAPTGAASLEISMGKGLPVNPLGAPPAYGFYYAQ